MNKLPNITINCQIPEHGFGWKVDLDFTLFFPKLKETFGIDLQPVIILLFTKLVKKMIRVLERTKEIQELTTEEEKELTNLKEQDKNLNTWSKHLGINHE